VNYYHRLGQVFAPAGQYEWMQSHASSIVPRPLSADIVRVYFSCRDKGNRSSIAWVDIRLRADQFEVVALADAPVISPGTLGAYDDSGLSLGWIITIDGREWLYYVAWNLAVTVPYRNSIGLAELIDEGRRAKRVSSAPLLDRSDCDPYSLSYPCIIKDQGQYRMWYGSCKEWLNNGQAMVFVIKHAVSNDGQQWTRTGTVIEGKHPGDCVFARPCVIKEKDGYRMWLTVRGDRYRIVYAESKDGLCWHLKERFTFNSSESGWDSEMVCYPYVLEIGGQRYMFYNGNSYGKTGFGVARIEHWELNP
jgi:hypothetical protein